MNLVIDIGNSLVKYAVFYNQTLVWEDRSTPDLFLSKIKALFEGYPKISHAILCPVGEVPKKDRDVVALFCPVHVLNPASRVPFKNSYATPQLLGADRIALTTAAFYQYPQRNTLVIDAGTCITYDVVNDTGEYMGGAIAPGVTMRYKALHAYTTALPLLKPETELLTFIGNSTQSCMHSGVINGVACEVDGMIDRYRSHFQEIKVVLTGGDAPLLAKKLKNTIFADAKLLLQGLNYVLEYNKMSDG